MMGAGCFGCGVWHMEAEAAWAGCWGKCCLRAAATGTPATWRVYLQAGSGRLHFPTCIQRRHRDLTDVTGLPNTLCMVPCQSWKSCTCSASRGPHYTAMSHSFVRMIPQEVGVFLFPIIKHFKMASEELLFLTLSQLYNIFIISICNFPMWK